LLKPASSATAATPTPAVTLAHWQALATLAAEGDVSGIEDWIAALPAAAAPQSQPARVAEWARTALNRLDFALLQQTAERIPCQNP